MSRNLFRKELDILRPYVPGKPIEEVQKEYGIDKIEKLASNENPLGPSPKSVEAIIREVQNINFYPDSYAMKLKEAIAEKVGLTHENIVVGNGGEQTLAMVAQVFIDHGDEAIMADTTFSLYETSVLNMGGVAVKLPLKNYKHDLDGFVEKINDKTKIIYICNPNNPVGNILTKNEIYDFVAKVPEDIVILFDEAYYNYAKVNPEYPETLDILVKRPNTIILRTFSKVGGVAGVRVGYVLTSKEIATQMGKVKDVFNVNSLAQVAALAVLEDEEHIEKTIKLNYESLALMEKYFDENNLEYVKSNANFIFVNVGVHSKWVFEELMKQGVIIRPGFLWGWDNWLRVSTGTIKQTEKFIKALDRILKV
jgi:histidinol-phosphate aminotransferase